VLLLVPAGLGLATWKSRKIFISDSKLIQRSVINDVVLLL
jgi:hypothetical protein